MTRTDYTFADLAAPHGASLAPWTDEAYPFIVLIRRHLLERRQAMSTTPGWATTTSPKRRRWTWTTRFAR